MFFDVYFSLAHGFEIDFPFLNLWLSTQSILVVLISVILLRIRKILIDRKRNSVSKVSETNFTNEFENDFEIDWSK